MKSLLPVSSRKRFTKIFHQKNIRTVNGKRSNFMNICANQSPIISLSDIEVEAISSHCHCRPWMKPIIFAVRVHLLRWYLSFQTTVTCRGSRRSGCQCFKMKMIKKDLLTFAVVYLFIFSTHKRIEKNREYIYLSTEYIPLFWISKVVAMQLGHQSEKPLFVCLNRKSPGGISR